VNSIKDWGIYDINLGVPYENEQGLERPGIVIRNTYGICIIIPLTTNVADLNRFSYTIRINRSEGNRLDADSVALVFHIRAVAEKRIRRAIGELDPVQRELVKAQLKEVLHLL
jgi:mRNA-degrading endonuclease toxin of MazEF toxin-antitoxin module